MGFRGLGASPSLAFLQWASAERHRRRPGRASAVQAPPDLQGSAFREGFYASRVYSSRGYNPSTGFGFLRMCVWDLDM